MAGVTAGAWVTTLADAPTLDAPDMSTVEVVPPECLNAVDQIDALTGVYEVWAGSAVDAIAALTAGDDARFEAVRDAMNEVAPESAGLREELAVSVEACRRLHGAWKPIDLPVTVAVGLSVSASHHIVVPRRGYQ